MNKKEAISKLQQHIVEIKKVKATARFGPTFTKWQRDTKVSLSKIFPKENHADEFDKINYSLLVWTDSTPESEDQRAYLRGLEEAEAFLESCIREIDEYWTDEVDHSIGYSTTAEENTPLLLVEKLCSRFHLVVKQLRKRYDGRVTIDVADEYDVQDLLHGLLRVFFDDIRPEEVAPSYAGKSSRMDFLLKNHQLVVETKMTRKGLEAKEIGSQLIEDIARYKSHPDCKTLVCFVYDPEGRIANPSGLENDLNCEENDLNVRVIIVPKGY